MHTYQLGAPMSWKEFKALPDDLKCVYVLKLREKFNVNAVKLAEMFGVRGATVRRVCIDLGLSEKTHRNMSKAQIEAWKKFCDPTYGEEPEEEDAPIECEEEDNEVMDTKVEISKMPAEKKSGCSINSGILQFTGKAPDITISLMKFLGDSAYKISVEFSEITEE